MMLDKKLVNPFCRRPAAVSLPGLDNSKTVHVVSMDVDRETLEVHPVFETVDVVEQIQACKELCGMEFMKKLLASGQVTAEQLQDDAGAEIDLSVIPSNVFEAKKLADQENERLAKLAAAIGCQEGEHYSAKQLEAMLTEAVSERVNAVLAAQKAATEGGAQQ